MAYFVFLRFFYSSCMHVLTDGFLHGDEVPLNGQLHVLDLLGECLAKHPPCAVFLKDGALLRAVLERLPADTPRSSCPLLRAGTRGERA